jgi:hypothetical protein
MKASARQRAMSARERHRIFARPNFKKLVFKIGPAGSGDRLQAGYL